MEAKTGTLVGQELGGMKSLCYVEGLGLRVQSSGFRVERLGFKIKVLG